jgi:hypothetical protein
LYFASSGFSGRVFVTPSLEAAGGGATSAMAVKCAFWWWVRL